MAKAFIIRRLPATERQSMRVRVEVDQVKKATYSEGALHNFEQALITDEVDPSLEFIALQKYIENNNIDWAKGKKFQLGGLPNGDTCAVLVPEKTDSELFNDIMKRSAQNKPIKGFQMLHQSLVGVKQSPNKHTEVTFVTEQIDTSDVAHHWPETVGVVVWVDKYAFV